jgi:hypothetical protein
MSGQWEVVGKSKQKQSRQSTKKLSKSERKKFVENAPKVEDIRKYFVQFWCIPVSLRKKYLLCMNMTAVF